ncbi:hypothetical protein SUGI_1083230 [Cryptomeria japonica]|nr:hypothetical protein SUGI_1083230 [Cryptomeria japonica]
MVQGIKELRQGGGMSRCNEHMAKEGDFVPHQLEGYNERFVPPMNFAMVDKRAYRSSFPNRNNFPFLENLHLNSILSILGKNCTFLFLKSYYFLKLPRCVCYK